MKSFEEFRESRAAMDPSARRMTEHQWKQAYAAYISSRERVRGGQSGKRRSRDSEGSARMRGSHSPTLVSEAGVLRSQVRGETAYSDLRMLVDIFTWIAVALIVAGALITVIGYPNAVMSFAAIVGAGVQVILALALRLLAHVFIDIPDVALYRQVMTQKAYAGKDAVQTEFDA
ncbi:MAG: hypothetical protein AAF546_13885 [Verrucomicrobiota bacterium]